MNAKADRFTLSEKAYHELKGMISRGEFRPGQPLVTQTLANQFGMSRMPVIEAIRRLERDGLVDVAPRWGASMRRWTREDLLEAISIRRALEGEAARQFVLRATVTAKQKLLELNDKFDSFAGVDAAQCDEADVELHLHFARSTGLRRLADLIENSQVVTSVILGLSVVISPTQKVRHCGGPDMLGIRGCHKSLVEALLGDDPDQARDAIWQHIDTNWKCLVSLGEGTEQYSSSETSGPLEPA